MQLQRRGFKFSNEGVPQGIITWRIRRKINLTDFNWKEIKDIVQWRPKKRIVLYSMQEN